MHARLTKVVRFALHPVTRYVASWLLALSFTASCIFFSWIAFNDPKRRDGNSGHTMIDFGGQWLIGRMLVEGHGRDLYNRYVQRAVLQKGYPRADEEPYSHVSDADQLMSWLMGWDDASTCETVGSFLIPLGSTDAGGLVLSLAVLEQFWNPDLSYRTAQAIAPLAAGDPIALTVFLSRARQVWQSGRLDADFRVPLGGSLYPPLMAFYTYPLGLLPAQVAYRVSQLVNLVLAFVAGLGVWYLSRGRIWWPMASAVIIAYPGLGASCNLGQNAALTLAILVWGWALIARGRPGWGGVVWGLLALKPVWAAAFFLVPVLTRRWRTCLSMLATGAALAAATLPVVGVQCWRDWQEVGRRGARVYNTDQNWIFLSRDILSIPRRWMLDFSPGAERNPNELAPTLVGGGLLLLVLLGTAGLVLLRRDQARATEGPAAAFVLLGAWMSCFHFMYYDVLLTALPVLLLFTDARQYLEPHFLAVGPPRAPAPLLKAGYRRLWVVNRMVPTLALLLFVPEYGFPLFGLERHFGPPWETFILFVLWLWCARALVSPRNAGLPTSSEGHLR
jgi:hypothetical protein